MQGFMGAWIYGCMGLWVHGFMTAWVYGCMGLRVHGLIGAWDYGCKGLWVHGFMGASVYESRLREHVSMTYKLKFYSIFGNTSVNFGVIGYKLGL